MKITKIVALMLLGTAVGHSMDNMDSDLARKATARISTQACNAFVKDCNINGLFLKKSRFVAILGRHSIDASQADIDAKYAHLRQKYETHKVGLLGRLSALDLDQRKKIAIAKIEKFDGDDLKILATRYTNELDGKKFIPMTIDHSFEGATYDRLKEVAIMRKGLLLTNICLERDPVILAQNQTETRVKGSLFAQAQQIDQITQGLEQTPEVQDTETRVKGSLFAQAQQIDQITQGLEQTPEVQDLDKSYSVIDGKEGKINTPLVSKITYLMPLEKPVQVEENVEESEGSDGAKSEIIFDSKYNSYVDSEAKKSQVEVPGNPEGVIVKKEVAPSAIDRDIILVEKNVQPVPVEEVIDLTKKISKKPEGKIFAEKSLSELNREEAEKNKVIFAGLNLVGQKAKEGQIIQLSDMDASIKKSAVQDPDKYYSIIDEDKKPVQSAVQDSDKYYSIIDEDKKPVQVEENVEENAGLDGFDDSVIGSEPGSPWIRSPKASQIEQNAQVEGSSQIKE